MQNLYKVLILLACVGIICSFWMKSSTKLLRYRKPIKVWRKRINIGRSRKSKKFSGNPSLGPTYLHLKPQNDPQQYHYGFPAT